ncbi:unnamed protein product [Amoebophrya sp. A25]|nr:unnamed protein product [Amoebophrya sp. A25]|eukprot:GSA25T00021963001.1
MVSSSLLHSMGSSTIFSCLDHAQEVLPALSSNPSRSTKTTSAAFFFSSGGSSSSTSFMTTGRAARGASAKPEMMNAVAGDGRTTTRTSTRRPTRRRSRIETAFNDDVIWEVYNQRAKKRLVEILTAEKNNVEHRLREREAVLKAEVAATKRAQKKENALSDETDKLAGSNAPEDRDQEAKLLEKESNATGHEATDLEYVQKLIKQVNRLKIEFEGAKKTLQKGQIALTYANTLVEEAKHGKLTDEVQCVDPKTLARITDKESCDRARMSAKRGDPRRKCLWNQLGDYSCTMEKEPAVGLSLAEFRLLERIREQRRSLVELTRERMKQENVVKTDVKWTMRNLRAQNDHVDRFLRQERDGWGRRYKQLLEQVLAVQHKYVGQYATSKMRAEKARLALEEQKEVLKHDLIDFLKEGYEKKQKLNTKLAKAQAAADKAHPEFRDPRKNFKPHEIYTVKLTPFEKKALEKLDKIYPASIAAVEHSEVDLTSWVHRLQQAWDEVMRPGEALHPDLRSEARLRKFAYRCEDIVDAPENASASLKLRRLFRRSFSSSSSPSSRRTTSPDDPDPDNKETSSTSLFGGGGSFLSSLGLFRGSQDDHKLSYADKVAGKHDHVNFDTNPNKNNYLDPGGCATTSATYLPNGGYRHHVKREHNARLNEFSAYEKLRRSFLLSNPVVETLFLKNPILDALIVTPLSFAATQTRQAGRFIFADTLHLMPASWFVTAPKAPEARHLMHALALKEVQNVDLLRAYAKYQAFYRNQYEPVVDAARLARRMQQRVERRAKKTERQIAEALWVANEADKVLNSRSPAAEFMSGVDRRATAY